LLIELADCPNQQSAISNVMVPIVYSSQYEIDLPGHIWPTTKYRRIAERLMSERIVPEASLVPPQSCSWDDLAGAHTHEYLDKVRTESLTPDEIRTLELPWVSGLADAFRLMTGGTCVAADLAVEHGSAIHLGGGFHHAFANHGEGFCLFNDVAVAIRRLQRSGRIERAAVVDCDVHHGNGTSAIFEQDPSVFTFSIHQQHNYPLFKPRSDLDIGLDDGADDREYLGRLSEALPLVMSGQPQIVFYLAGADPFERDRLGGLLLSFDGLRRRDRAVFDAARSAGAAVAVVLAGGYAMDVEDTVHVHVNTVKELVDVSSLST
jgi:acetoin utilization deacetylase AcuC-like enzyme